MRRNQRLRSGLRVGGRGGRRGATGRRNWVAAVGLLLCGCSTEYLPVALTPEGEHVVVAETDPPAACDEPGADDKRTSWPKTTSNGPISFVPKSSAAWVWMPSGTTTSTMRRSPR